MKKERISWDEMSIKIRAGDHTFAIETLLSFLKAGTESIIYRRPLLFSKRGTLYNAGMGLKMSDNELFRVKKVEVVSDLVERTTEKGDLLLRCLFSLPYVQEVRFSYTGDFDIVVYPPYDLKDEITAGLLESEIKASVDIAAGKKLAIVDDLISNDRFKEVS